MPVGSSKPANIRAYLGGSGTGKTLSVRQYLEKRRPARLLVWDSLGEFEQLAPQAMTLRDLVESTKGARWAWRYVPPPGEPKRIAQAFEVFCQVAFRSTGATVYVEELSTVTSPARAPSGWSRLVSAGRHQGLTVIGTAQRPAMIDKTFLGNCTTIRTTGGFRYVEDSRVVAGVLRVPLDEVDELRPLHWIERDFGSGKLARGVLAP